MITPDLIKWLRDNSSGIYRPGFRACREQFQNNNKRKNITNE